jgi:hypothetical protein
MVPVFGICLFLFSCSPPDTYKGSIRVEGFLPPTTSCPDCNSQCGLECFQKKQGKECWIPNVYCRFCGYTVNRTVFSGTEGNSPSTAFDNTSSPQISKPRKRIKLKEIKVLLYTNGFAKAEHLLRILLKKTSKDLNLMEYLDQALNGQNKTKQSDKLAEKIQAKWYANEREQWVIRGRPMEESSFCRLVLNDCKRPYRVLAKQYFEPEVQQQTHKEGDMEANHPTSLLAYFKVLAMPKASNSKLPQRLFKLVLGPDGTALQEHFSSGGQKKLKSYDSSHHQMPNIRQVAKDVVNALQTEEVEDGTALRSKGTAEWLVHAVKLSLGGRPEYKKISTEEHSETEDEADLSRSDGAFPSSSLPPLEIV